MTSANTAEGRKTVLSVGRAPLITPVAKPIAKPPSVAVQSRSIPPTTTPTRTTIVSLSAKSGDERELHGQDHRDRGGEEAGEEHGDADHASRTPSSRAVRKSVAAARICRPIVVRASRRRAARASRLQRRLRRSSPCARRRRRS